MKLYQVRKGQFVYYNNELHKVYGVKPMYKLSVHLLRLRDLSQHITNAASVEKYKPKDRDSFIFNHRAYTLSHNKKAEVGDYVLIHNPMPDALDTYILNEIDVAESVDQRGVVTSNSHGIKHYEYMLMIPGRAPDSNPIDYENTEGTEVDNEQNIDVSTIDSDLLPSIGDIYKKKDSTELFEAMVIAVKGQNVYLGGGIELSLAELINTDQWEFLYNLLDK
jgi:hypothetical protein